MSPSGTVTSGGWIEPGRSPRSVRPRSVRRALVCDRRAAWPDRASQGPAGRRGLWSGWAAAALSRASLGRRDVLPKAVIPRGPLAAPRLRFLGFRSPLWLWGMWRVSAGSWPCLWARGPSGSRRFATPHRSPRTDGKIALLSGVWAGAQRSQGARPSRRRPSPGSVRGGDVGTFGLEQLRAQQVVSVIFLPTRVCGVKGESYSNFNCISSP